MNEQAFSFKSNNNDLAGIIHKPDNCRNRGILSIVAGGPQYRAGCCRQLVLMARRFAESGCPVMRFDQAGMGDSSGTYMGFEHISSDINAAISEFKKRVPELTEVVLWGGCDAASAILIHGTNNATVTGLILANPWVHTEESHAAVLVRHYYWKRFLDRTFWKKVFTLKLDILPTLNSFFHNVLLSLSKQKNTLRSEENKDTPFPERMLAGASNYKRRILLMMSGLSMVSKEFDELIRSSDAWKKAMLRDGVTRVDFPDADQTFATLDDRDQQIDAAVQWMTEWQNEDEK